MTERPTFEALIAEIEKAMVEVERAERRLNEARTLILAARGMVSEQSILPYSMVHDWHRDADCWLDEK